MAELHSIKVARNAMATRFEALLWGENPVSLRAMGEEALEEIERLDAMLSLYRAGSEIQTLNGQAGREWVRVSPEVFALLRRAKALSEETAGAFDITIAPLMRCWGFMAGSGQMPEPKELEDARARVGMRRLLLDERKSAARFEVPGMMLDLGAIGKGYALERAAEILREAGAASALIHGGTSTVCAIGAPPEEEGWKVSIDDPRAEEAGTALPPLAVVSLRDESLSVSAPRGKAFEAEGKTYGHVIDPRTGAPAQGAVLAAVILPSAAETDALSTALLVAGRAGHEQLQALRPWMRTLVAEPSPDGTLALESFGLDEA